MSELGICFVPLLIGLAVGLGIRFCHANGTFDLASIAVVLVLLSGLAGSAFQLKIMFDHRLKIMAEETYAETLAYAKRAVLAEADEEALRRYMANNEVSVIGRLTPVGGKRQLHNYWEARNFIHLHWVASRNIILYGQGGADKTIWEASRVLEEHVFLDDVVSAVAKHGPVTDADLARFHQYELPFLKKMVNGEASREEFEEPLIAEVRSRVGWMTFVQNGFGSLLGICMFWGSVIAYKLVRQPSENEVV